MAASMYPNGSFKSAQISRDVAEKSLCYGSSERREPDCAPGRITVHNRLAFHGTEPTISLVEML